MRTSTCLVISVFLVALASCKDEPKFVSIDQTITVNKTDPITLPCIFDKLPSIYQVEWKKLPGENDGPSEIRPQLAIGNILIDQNGKSVVVNHQVTANLRTTNIYKLLSHLGMTISNSLSDN